MASPSDPARGTGTFVSPVPGPAVVTSDYGPRVLRSGPNFHHGIDFRAAVGTPLSAVDGGTVLYAGWSPQGFGNVVILDHGNGVVTTTAHLSAVGVRAGDVVEAGGPIGLSGNTGYSEGPHVHLEVTVGGDVDAYRAGYTRNRGGRAIDPERFLPLDGRAAAPYVDQVVFRRGDHLPAVERVQADLIAAGYVVNGGVPTGYYGSQTEAAVRQFQADRGFSERDVDGRFGPQTRGALADHLAERAPDDASSRPRGVLDTDGPFAAVSVGALYGVPGGTPLGALDAEQTYALSRAVFGDGPGAAALQALDQHYGPGDGTLVRRELALAHHEGRLNVGRQNADPASGYNVGTFQIGGARSTPEVSRARYDGLVADGIARYEALAGVTVDLAALSPADRDVFSHIGHVAEKGRISATSTVDAHFARLADPALQGDELARFVSREVQVGVAAIGRSVVAQTDPRTGVGIDLAAVAARGREPDATRAEPALPVLSTRAAADYAPAVEEWQRTLTAAGYDVGPAGPDGDFGPRTLAATQRAQRDAGLSDDGIVGADTWGAYAPERARAVAPDAPAEREALPGSPAREAPAISPAQAARLLQAFDQQALQILAPGTDAPGSVLTALNEAAASRGPLSAEDVERALSDSTSPGQALPAGASVALAEALAARAEVAAAFPAVAAAVDAARTVGLEVASPTRGDGASQEACPPTVRPIEHAPAFAY